MVYEVAYWGTVAVTLDLRNNFFLVAASRGHVELLEIHQNLHDIFTRFLQNHVKNLWIFRSTKWTAFHSNTSVASPAVYSSQLRIQVEGLLEDLKVTPPKFYSQSPWKVTGSPKGNESCSNHHFPGELPKCRRVCVRLLYIHSLLPPWLFPTDASA